MAVGCAPHRGHQSADYAVARLDGPQIARWPVRCRVYKALAVFETQGHAGHYKVNSTRSLKHTTHLLWPRAVQHTTHTHTLQHTSRIHAHWAVP